MQINGNGQFIYNNRKNSCGTNLLKLPAKKLNVQSRNVNNYGNNIFQSNNIQKNSLYSTKEATPRKEYKTVLNTGKKIQEKIDPLDDLNNIMKQNQINIQNLEKELNSRKNDFSIKNDEFLNIKKKYEDTLKSKEEEILIMKMDRDKVKSLNDQKMNYVEKEINNYRRNRRRKRRSQE